jgi:preprotein translocase subunit SecB
MAEQEQAAEKQLAINKIYVKDFSFESPQAPGVFTRGDWKPQTGLNLRSTHNAIEGNAHEIVLTITVEAKDGDNTLFLVELHQAGIFDIQGYSKEELEAIVGSFCPNILFPYARETIATIVQKGGFPEFVLQPINFDALYLQAKQQQQAQGAAAEAH